MLTLVQSRILPRSAAIDVEVNLRVLKIFPGSITRDLGVMLIEFFRYAFFGVKTFRPLMPICSSSKESSS